MKFSNIGLTWIKSKFLFFTFFIFGLQNHVLSQVNLQTGSANYSIPIFDWDDGRTELASSLALVYNSGNGLKANDVASNVGQGWNLMAGGFITRVQVGEPDDQPAFEGTAGKQNKTKYPAGYLYASVDPDKGCPKALTKYPTYKEMNKMYSQNNIVAEDKQPDYFTFQFNGKSGMFVLSDFNGDKGVTIGYSKLKINFFRSNQSAQGIRTTINSFSIQDEDGIIYWFKSLSLSKVLRTEFSDYKKIALLKQPDLGDDKVFYQNSYDDPNLMNPYVVTGWYLSEIEDPFSGRKVFFNYTTRSLDNPAGYEISYNRDKSFGVVAFRRSVTKTPYLSSINYPDGYGVAINYGADRFDFIGDKVISSVDVTYNSRPVSRHILGTTYFIGNRYGLPVEPDQKKKARLCLRSVKKIGIDLKDDTPPFLFDYFQGSDAADDKVPAPFAYTKDVWGYYNGTSSVGFNNEAISILPEIPELNLAQVKGLCFWHSSATETYLNPKNGYAKNGLLKQIVLPGGGTLSYDYTQNMATVNGVYRTVGGVHLFQTKSTDGGYSNGCANPIVTNYNFELDQAGNPSSLWGVEMPYNRSFSSSKFIPENRNYRYKFPFGECYYVYFYPGILSVTQSVDLTWLQKASASPVMNILSAVTTVLDVISLACGVSVFMSWVGIICTIVSGIITILYTCLHDFSDTNSAWVHYNFDFNSISPLPAQFKRVVVQQAGGGTGRTVYDFTSDADYPIWEPINSLFSAKQRFAPWAYGLPKVVTNYDALGNKIKDVKNTYNFSSSRGLVEYCFMGHGLYCTSVPLDTRMIACKCDVQEMSSQRNDDWSNVSLYNAPANYATATIPNVLGVEFYGIYTGNTLLQSTKETVFKVGDQTSFTEKLTDFSYNNGTPNYEVSKIRITNSKGDFETKEIYYPGNYTGGIFNTLATNNVVSLPIVTKSTLVKSDYTVYNLSETVTEYSVITGGYLKPSRVLEQRLALPVLNGQAGFTSYSGTTTNYANYAITQQFFYNSTADLIGMKAEGNRIVTTIYDYSPVRTVATIINADPLTDKTCYTSFETSSLGGWTIAGGAALRVVDNAITGDNYLVLNSRTLSSPITTTKPYILSFWASGPTTVSAGSTLVKTGPTAFGFTYYEYNITQGTTSVSLSGSVNIDELRLYPSTARINTVAYDPLIGKTAECDENNRITYYEYDKLGRLSFIKDEKKNIVKTYEYNSVYLQNGCPGIYYNKLIIESFYRTTCGSTYLGGDKPYTIPANKYSSTISQEDADAQAQKELLEQGQAIADASGPCTLLYFNDLQSSSFVTQSCVIGYKGQPVTYTVPANRYSSTISKAAANAMALFELNSNAAAYANDSATASCVIDNNPQWDWLDENYCLSVNGQLPAHEFVKIIDINPNSSTYNQISWQDIGVTQTCPAGTYFNAEKSQSFQKSCSTGYTGSFITYIVPPGKYSSTVSQIAADQLALNDISANGQNYANSSPSGVCTPNPTCSFSAASGFTIASSSISSSAGTVNFTIVFYSTAGNATWANTNLVATINGLCKPSVQRTVSMTSGGGNWQITISTSGQFSIRLVSGTAPTGSNPVILTNGSFSL